MTKSNSTKLREGNSRVTMSIPTSQVERIDRHAENLGISRNAFMQVAIAEYMANREFAHGGVVEMLKQAIIDEVSGKISGKSVSE